MSTEINALILTAASMGFFHTILGPDHYLPFVMISWAKKWSGLKTAVITFLCGIGHILSSVILGLVGVAFGIMVGKLQIIESFRGNIAAWLFIAFGLVYFVWGLRRAYKNKPHTHGHIHIDHNGHTHEHTHHDQHSHIHAEKEKTNVTPWVLFIIFVFGPCEPLIPLLMYPAAKSSWSGLIMVTAVFGATTILTMMTLVLVARSGISFAKLNPLNKFSHAIAGATICLCGLAIVFLGL
ncbi:MAG: sulfite exporter TauE/SafE family protein [Phycisphaerae bacterium]|jgi:ABC-type nickel/cobalt efflux system permease component RcnA